MEAARGLAPGATQQYIDQQQEAMQRMIYNQANGVPNSDYQAFEMDMNNKRRQHKAQEAYGLWTGQFNDVYDGFQKPANQQ